LLTSLEESNIQLLNSLNICSKIENILINIPCPYVKIVNDKLKYVLEKNEGYKTIKIYSEVMAENQNINLVVASNF
jgi:hypothetical protein